MERPEPRPRARDEELTLDPTSDAGWDELRSLGRTMLDDMLHHLRSVRDRPAWQPVPEEARRVLAEGVPREPTDARRVYEVFRRHVLPYTNGNTHPGFWGWAQGTGTPLAMLADMCASAMNPHVAGFEQSAVLVEERVVAWIGELLRFPVESTGVLTSGGTMANLLGVAVARHAAATDAGFDLRAHGLQHPECPRFVLFASAETHGWIQKTAELLGLGRAAVENVPVDDEHRMRLGDLEARIADARRAGKTPIAVVATCGTVNTGAIDDLPALADLSARERIWLHVDGALGALAALSPRHAHLVAGLERADSLAVDLHKWMYLPFEIACVLVRRPGVQRATFAREASYLAPVGRGVAAGPLVFADRGIELTRGFRALKAWMVMKTHGTTELGSLVGQNIDQAEHVASRIEASPDLELLAPRRLNVVCFRYVERGASASELDALNQEILLRIQESGVAVPSSTRIGGRFALRIAVMNHRSVRADFDRFLDAVVRHGREIRLAR